MSNFMVACSAFGYLTISMVFPLSTVFFIHLPKPAYTFTSSLPPSTQFAFQSQ